MLFTPPVLQVPKQGFSSLENVLAHKLPNFWIYVLIEGFLSLGACYLGKLFYLFQDIYQINDLLLSDRSGHFYACQKRAHLIDQCTILLLAQISLLINRVYEQIC